MRSVQPSCRLALAVIAVAFTAETRRATQTYTGKEGSDVRKEFSRIRAECGVKELIRMQLVDSLKHIRALRQDYVFQLRSVGDEGVERADASYGSVEIFKQFVRDARCDLCAVTPRK